MGLISRVSSRTYRKSNSMGADFKPGRLVKLKNPQGKISGKHSNKLDNEWYKLTVDGHLTDECYMSIKKECSDIFVQRPWINQKHKTVCFQEECMIRYPMIGDGLHCFNNCKLHIYV